jgi:hypothetical protein
MDKEKNKWDICEDKGDEGDELISNPGTVEAPHPESQI